MVEGYVKGVHMIMRACMRAFDVVTLAIYY